MQHLPIKHWHLQSFNNHWHLDELKQVGIVLVNLFIKIVTIHNIIHIHKSGMWD